MKKDIFLVDADDTILDFHASSTFAIRYAFESLGLPCETEYLSAFEKLNNELWEMLERKEISREKLIATRFSLYLESLKLNLDADKFNQSYLKYLAENPIFMDGAKAFLKTLSSLGRVFIVTNGTEKIQNSRFTIGGIFDMVEDVFISQRIGYDKPAKGYIDYVESHIKGYERERAVFIGDSLSADIKCANVAGIDSIWFNPKGKLLTGKGTPDYTVNEFDEILKILQNWQEK